MVRYYYYYQVHVLSPLNHPGQSFVFLPEESLQKQIHRMGCTSSLPAPRWPVRGATVPLMQAEAHLRTHTRAQTRPGVGASPLPGSPWKEGRRPGPPALSCPAVRGDTYGSACGRSPLRPLPEHRSLRSGGPVGGWQRAHASAIEPREGAWLQELCSPQPSVPPLPHAGPWREKP